MLAGMTSVGSYREPNGNATNSSFVVLSITHLWVVCPGLMKGRALFSWSVKKCYSILFVA